jgi:1-acyl-sn-glycerol-3-phosphate acyltransferase
VLRSVAFNLAFCVWTAALGVLGLPVLLLPRKAAMALGRFWSQGAVVLLRAVVGLDYEVRGFDRIPRGGCIVAMKHQSAWDGLILPVALDDPAAVIKRELLWLPFYGWYVWRAGSIVINRKAGVGALRHMVAAARAAVAAGRPIVIFPEGTRVMPGARLPYQPGVYALAQALSLPVVPAAVNSGLFWRRRGFIKRPGRIILEFLEPIPPGLLRREMMTLLEDHIETATAALIAEASRTTAIPTAAPAS